MSGYAVGWHLVELVRSAVRKRACRLVDARARVLPTADHAGPGRLGHVGAVTRLLPSAQLDARSTVAISCGRDVIMRFPAAALPGTDPRRRLGSSLRRPAQSPG